MIKLKKILSELKYKKEIPKIYVLPFGNIEIKYGVKVSPNELVKYLNSVGIKSGIYHGKIWYDRELTKDRNNIIKIKDLLRKKFGDVVSKSDTNEYEYIETDPKDEIQQLKTNIGTSFGFGDKKIIQSISIDKITNNENRYKIVLTNGDIIIAIKADKWRNNFIYEYKSKRIKEDELRKIIFNEFMDAMERFKHSVDTHDWTYQFSDDHRSWLSGEGNLKTMGKNFNQLDDKQKQEAFKYYNGKAAKFSSKDLKLKIEKYEDFIKFMNIKG